MSRGKVLLNWKTTVLSEMISPSTTKPSVGISVIFASNSSTQPIITVMESAMNIPMIILIFFIAIRT